MSDGSAKLPRDPAYWESLARRINKDAEEPLAAYTRARERWFDVLDRRAPWLVAASLAVLIALWLGLPARSGSPAHDWIERSVAPSETAGTLVGGARPPSVDALLAQFAPPSFGEEP